MFWSFVILVLITSILGFLLFMPLSITLASKSPKKPNKEAHDYEDIREFFVEEDTDVSAHYHLNNEGTNTIM